MAKKKILVAAVTGLLIVGIGVGLGVLQNDKPPVKSASVTTRTLTSEVVGLVVRADTSLVQKAVNKGDQNTGQLWSLGSPEGNKEEFVIDANFEQGESLKKLTGYTRQPLRDSVVANINLQLPKQFPEYKELTQRNLAVNGIDATETVFEYTTSGVRVKQRLLLLFKSSDTAVYLRGQAKADQYDSVNSHYFEPLFSSAKFE